MTRRIAIVALMMLQGCGEESNDPSPSTGSGGGVGQSSGGTSTASGGSGTGTGGSGNGGIAVGSGGATEAGGGPASSGGTTPGTGGATAGTGGTAGGAGGTSSSGGSGGSATGGAGGTSTGGASNGTGGNAGGTGGSANCPLPSTFRWRSTGPVAEPKSPSGRSFVSLKDFTAVRWNDKYVVYATVFDTTASWSGVTFNFSDWEQAAAAPQTYLGTTPLGGVVAPTLFYFTPKNIWVLAYQWGFKYATGTDPTKPSTWTAPRSLLSGDPTGDVGTGPIDQTVICDAARCYLFFAADNGNIYRASMPIGEFPGTFRNAVSIMRDTTANLFEGVQVYTVKGTGKFLMIVEAMGARGRYFRAFTADTLDGTFRAMPSASTEATPFAGKNNVTFTGTAWTNDISHGDIVRENPSETQTIDPCKLEFLYQGRNPSQNPAYERLPYRPGVLTLAP